MKKDRIEEEIRRLTEKIQAMENESKRREVAEDFRKCCDNIDPIVTTTDNVDSILMYYNSFKNCCNTPYTVTVKMPCAITTNKYGFDLVTMRLDYFLDLIKKES